MGIKSGLDFNISWREGTHGTDCIAGKNTQHIMCLLTPRSSLCSSSWGINLYLPLFRSLWTRGVIRRQMSSCFYIPRDSLLLLLFCALHDFWKKQRASAFIVSAAWCCGIPVLGLPALPCCRRVEERAGCSFRLSPSHLIKPSPSGAEKRAWDQLPAPVGSRM